MTARPATLRQRLAAALAAFRNPDRVPASHACPEVPAPLPEPEVGLPPHLYAKPLYSHWHPSGRTLYGWLHLTRDGHQALGFTPVSDGYDITADALSLQAVLGGEMPPFPIARWEHAVRGSHYWTLRRATAQASGGPILDNEDVWIYEDKRGELFIRRPGEFLDGRFRPLDDLARQVQERGRL